MIQQALALLGVVVAVVVASPIRQHVVPSARRHVPYRHLPTTTTIATTPIHRSFTADDATTWTVVHADASIHSVNTAKEGIVEGNDDSWWNVAWLRKRRRRRRRLNSGDDTLFLGINNTEDAPFTDTADTNHTSTSDGAVYTFSDVTADNASIVGTDNTARNIPYQPIRMQAFLGSEAGGGEFLHPRQHKDLLLRVIRPALIYWSAALRVAPVAGNLTVDPSQLLQHGRSCGPPDGPQVEIPEAHVTYGVENADFLLYVNLAFQNGTEVLGSKDSENIPQVCSGEYFAASTFCSTDQHDRPTAAILHLCIDDEFFAEERQESNIMVVLHELGHALGFNAVSLAHFRATDGSPLTARDPVTGDIPLTDVQCTGPVDEAITLQLPVPSREIVQFRTVRGGLRVAEIVTPLVRQVVRNHFDCQELPGAELESGEPTSCLGDHWERRLFKTELLNPLIDEVAFNPLFSSLTLAYFADSGWYQVDLSRASSAAGWGRAAGCDFVEKECVQDGQVPSQYESFFCNQPSNGGVAANIQGCTHDLVSKAFCSLENYDGELPSVFRYFNGSNVGGGDPFMDYCPVYSGFSNGLCSDKQNEAVIRVSGLERFGRRNSRCLAGRKGNLVVDEITPAPTPLEGSWAADDDLVPVPPAVRIEHTTDSHDAMCIPIACVVEDQSLRLQVDGIWEVCHNKDDVIIPHSALENLRNGLLPFTETVSILCPDPVRVCPTFYCKRDCLGTDQICDYDTGQCVCPDGGELHNGLCKPRNNTTAFFQPAATESELPDPKDPLSAIYVPRARSLRDESRYFWTVRNSLLLVSAIGMVTAVMTYLAWPYVGRLLPLRTSHGDDHAPDESPNTRESSINAEKHKMVASVLVDMRMNAADLQDGADTIRNRDSETEMSATDTESSMHDRSFSFPATIADLSEHIELPSSQQQQQTQPDELEYNIDPLAPPSTARVVRRRGLFSRFSKK